MAARAEESGSRGLDGPVDVLVLSVLAGAFIAFGAIFATTVSAGTHCDRRAGRRCALSAGLPYGVVRLLTGLVFCSG